jgi:long-chain-fatty-acid--[acyl-carrier-protein] ligase
MFMIIRNIVKILLWLRYRITIKGIDAVAEKGTTGILFLPNHPALIDPIILNTYLHKTFSPRPIADEIQIDRPLIRTFSKTVRALSIPDMAKAGAKGGNEINRALKDTVKALQKGDNILLYPAGHLAHSMFEDLGANSAVDSIAQTIPHIRIVLVCTKGLWGSSFGHGSGKKLNLNGVIFKAFKAVLLNGIIFGPRREVKIEFYEPEDFPKSGGRQTINSYIENFYNKDASNAIYVPYSVWEKRGTSIIPEPESRNIEKDISTVPDTTRDIIIGHLKELTGIEKITPDLRLAHDLGMDSLARAELIVWISQEFGFPQGDTDSMQTVADCILAACGQAIASNTGGIKAISKKWFKDEPGTLPAVIPAKDKITDVFLQQCLNHPDHVIIADQTAGAKTYRQIVAGIYALCPAIKKIPGNRIGIMLPASAVTSIVYLAVLFSGKAPVMINWTVGERSLKHCIKLSEINHILTSRKLTRSLESQNVVLDPFINNFVFLENISAKLSQFNKISALIKSYTSIRLLQKAHISETAVILFTSGSENLPKAVPLTHENLLANICDVGEGLSLFKNDRLIGMLPPFHSFGLTGTLVLPLCAGIKSVYHPNPTEAIALAGLIEAYKVSILVGTPTFLNGIARSATPHQLASLKLAFSGAEKCPESVYKKLKILCPNLKILEGYGITECSPVVSYNRPESAKPYTIGKVIDSLDYVIIDVDTRKKVAPGDEGILLVRGPSIFNGYLNYEGKSPFVEFEKTLWYNTDDIVKEDADNILTFCGRLKRFVKLGGEMISLPAIESVLLAAHDDEDKAGPILAVAAANEENHPEIVLFTMFDADRSSINRLLQKEGLSSLHNIRRIIKLDSIPVLGTGKTDYRSLKKMLDE